MSNGVNIVTIAESAILFAGIWIILFWLWPSVRLDCYRQRMFEVRDELFDYAASGRIDFAHPAYRLLRQSMNGFIRYGHQATFWQFLMTWSAWKVVEGRDSFQWERKWKAALDPLSPDTREDMLEFHSRASMLVGERIVLGSPVLIVSLLVSLVIVLFHMSWKSARGLISTALSETAARAIDQRILDEEAARAAA